MDQQLITRIVEAALLAASQPLTLSQLHALFLGDALEEAVPASAIDAALRELQAGCAGRGVELVEVASGWRFQVAADVHPWVSRLWAERQAKYTRATLETLALIAYRQPITRGEIEQIRGVAVNSNIIKALEEREWIRVVGHRDVPGRPELLGTTRGFLDYFGLQRLDQLPPLSELKDFGELEPQLPLGSIHAGTAAGDDTDPAGDADPDNDADAGASAGIPQHDDGEDEVDATASAPEQDEDE
jgi:segregation and condensation protein B